MNRVWSLALMIALLVAVAPLASAEEPEERRKDTPTYESPILSLLFLPVNVLIKMASVLTPEDSAKASREKPRAADSGK